jgi:hypothetical protein
MWETHIIRAEQKAFCPANNQFAENSLLENENPTSYSRPISITRILPFQPHLLFPCDLFP